MNNGFAFSCGGFGILSECGAHRTKGCVTEKADANGRLRTAVNFEALRPCPEESEDWDTTKNLYIEGDNLDVLKLLQESWHERVNLIVLNCSHRQEGR